MTLLSRVSYVKMHLISTRVEIRSTLNILGLINDKKAEQENKKDFFRVMELTKNLNAKDRKRLRKSGMKAKKRI